VNLRVGSKSIAIRLLLFSALYPICAIGVFAAHFVISSASADFLDFFPMFYNRLRSVFLRFAVLVFVCGALSYLLCRTVPALSSWAIWVLFTLFMSLLLEWYGLNGFSQFPDYGPFVVSQTMLGGAMALLASQIIQRFLRFLWSKGYGRT